jgi:TatD DNase family protein
MFEYFDVHSHLSFPDYDADREEIIAEMKEKKIGTISVGVDFETSKKELELAEKHENIFACVGQHPENLAGGFDERIAELAKNPKVVAIGECGLDYFRLPDDSGQIKKMQKEIFEKQIELSLEVEKPLMLHIRPSDKIYFDAYFDALEILEGYKKIHGEKLRGNAHFFVGSVEVLKRFLAIGFTVSFAGVVTFTDEYNEVVRSAPLGSIMSETDAPLVAPAPFRGKRNSPLFVPETVKKISEIRGEDFDLVKKTLVENAVRNFKLV